VGVLYVRKDVQDRVWPTIATSGWDTYKSAQKFETLSQRADALALAMGEAIEFQNHIGRPRIERRIHTLASHLKNQLMQVPGLKLHASRDNYLSAGLTAFSIQGVKPANLVDYLREKCNIVVRTIGNEEKGTLGVRVSTHIFVTLKDIDLLVAGVNDLSRLPAEPRDRQVGSRRSAQFLDVDPQLRGNGSRRRHQFVCGRRDQPAAVAPDEEPAVDPLLGRYRKPGDAGFIEDKDMSHVPVLPGFHADNFFSESAVFRQDCRFAPFEWPLVEIDEILDESVQGKNGRSRPARPQDNDSFLQEAATDLVPIGELAPGGTHEPVQPGDHIPGGLRGCLGRCILRLTQVGAQAEKCKRSADTNLSWRSKKQLVIRGFDFHDTLSYVKVNGTSHGRIPAYAPR
jgi:hypothetical protein